jgi:DNA-binding MarR family transcriptional regulator
MSLSLVPPIHRATHRIGLYLASLRGHSLSQGEAHILAQLASGRATIAELHKGLAHSRSTLTSILDRLVDRGLVTRAVGESDRRTFVVTTTAEGRRIARRVWRHLADLERAVRAQVSADEVRGFLKVVAAVEAEAARRISRAGSMTMPRNSSRTPSTAMPTTRNGIKRIHTSG